jgi:hypothetical protein
LYLRLLFVFVTQADYGRWIRNYKVVHVLGIIAYRGMEVHLHALIISETDGQEWSASRRGRFTCGRRYLLNMGLEVKPTPQAHDFREERQV